MLEIRGIWLCHMSRWDRYMLRPRVRAETSGSETVPHIGPYIAPTRACSEALHRRGDETARAVLRRRRCVDGRRGVGEGQVLRVLDWGSKRELGDAGIAAACGTQWTSRAGSRDFAAATTRSPAGGAALGRARWRAAVQ